MKYSQGHRERLRQLTPWVNCSTVGKTPHEKVVKKENPFLKRHSLFKTKMMNASPEAPVK